MITSSKGTRFLQQQDIYWPFNHEMDVAEELYHLTTDRYEMENLVDDPRHAAALDQMRLRYDQSLAEWASECVPTGNYPLFAKIYNRHLPWEEKIAAMDNRMRSKYLDWRERDKKIGVSGKSTVDAEKRAAKAATRAKRKAEQELASKS